MLNRLPLPDLDPNTLALLAAGVVGTGLDSINDDSSRWTLPFVVGVRVGF